MVPPIAMNASSVPAPIPPLSAEMAAVLAQRHRQAVCSDEDEADESSGPEFGSLDRLGVYATSGIRGECGKSQSPSAQVDAEVDDDDDGASGEGGGPAIAEPVVHILEGLEGVEGEDEDDVDVDEFPIPLRTRKGKEPVGVVGVKRKRT